MRQRKRAYDQQKTADRAAEQQQADQKKQMVGADQDVVDSGGQKLADHSENALPGAREVFELRVVAVEDCLRRKCAAFVEIQERLMRVVVGEKRGSHRQ